MAIALGELSDDTTPLVAVKPVLQRRFHSNVPATDLAYRFMAFHRLEAAIQRYIRRFRLQPGVLPLPTSAPTIFYANIVVRGVWYEVANPRLVKWMLQQLHRSPR